MDNGAGSYRRFLMGDQEAFDEIIRDYRSPLTFFINGFVHDSMIAEDIAIDVFTYILLHPGAYNGKTQFKTYLFMLGRSRALDHLRHQKRFATLSLSEAAAAEDLKSLEDAVIKNERDQRLYKAIKTLPEKMRTAVHLVYFEGLSYEEAAVVMKKSKKQVDNLLYRAKGLLRLQLEDGEQLL